MPSGSQPAAARSRRSKLWMNVSQWRVRIGVPQNSAQPGRRIAVDAQQQQAAAEDPALARAHAAPQLVHLFVADHAVPHEPWLDRKSSPLITSS